MIQNFLNRFILSILFVLILALLFCSCDSDPNKMKPAESMGSSLDDSIVPGLEEPEHTAPDNTVSPPPSKLEDTIVTTEPSVSGEPEAPTEPKDNPNETNPTESDSSEGTEPAPSEPSPSVPPVSNSVTYLEYYQMTGEQQQAFINSFDSIEAFFAWHTAAKEAYEECWTPIDGSTPFIP